MEALAQHTRVEPPPRAELRDLLEDLSPGGEVERDPRREVVHHHAAREHQLDVGGGDRQTVRHLLRGGAPGLADVIPADGHGVGARIVARRELDEIRDEAQRRIDRIDPRAPCDELFQDVILRRGNHALGRHTLLLGDGVVHGGDRRGHAVDRKRHAHAVERDAGERLLHVGERVDRHPDPADLAFRLGIVGVEAELRRQVEGDVERILPVRHQVLEPGVGLRRSAEADVLAHRPEPVAVHVLVDPARVRILTGPPDVAVEVDTRDVRGTIDRCDREAGVRFDLFHRVLLDPIARESRPTAQINAAAPS